MSDYKELRDRRMYHINALRKIANSRRSAPGDNIFEDAGAYIEELAIALEAVEHDLVAMREDRGSHQRVTKDNEDGR